MKNIFVFATSAILLLASCSKEKSIDSTDPDAPGAGGSNQGKGLLVKGVLIEGSDSMTTSYAYDAQNRLIRQSVSATYAGFINIDYQIERNSNGQIKSYDFSSTEFITLGLDSVVYRLNYDAGKSQYTHKTMEFEIQGLKIKDSTVYAYDNQNRIIKEKRFLRDPFTGVYINANMSDYAYNTSGDLTKMLSYGFDDDLNDYVLYYDVTYEYDNKANPLVLNNEAIIVEAHNLYGTHNVIKQLAIYPDDPANVINLIVDLTYNAENKPVVSAITDMKSGGKSTFKYYYN